MIYLLAIRFFVFGLIVYFLAKSIIILVPEGKVFLIERLGKFHKECRAGLYFLFPLIDKIVFKASLLEQAIKIPNIECNTVDSHLLKIQILSLVELIEPKNYFYSADRESITLESDIITLVKTEISGYYKEEIYGRRYGINQSILNKLQDKYEKIGVKVKTFSIEEIQ